MVKLDLTKELKELYRPSAKKVKLVNVPRMGFLMIDGEGDPNTAPRFRQAVKALYSLSHRLRFMVKQGRAAVDYKVMPLEGLWQTRDGAPLDPQNRDAFQWTLMIMQPDFVTPELFLEAREAVAKKKVPLLEDVRLDRYAEGLSAQILHIGFNSGKATVVDTIYRFAQEQGYEPTGCHHEIYLGDHRRTASEKRKTVIRYKVRKKE
ncbi:GyrI-like domain-containing protein [Dethiobacter alkaliphilus]|uniref:GyrI-like small molecule binding domain-containing protein n=1 Tax=Dethiobacter alkaliphilus AHT 1 TaxID=555088 RepID=C0GH97_DETAL|nr:GyrI-like domain-containing protein [Dethiobacter alkaliphilus]EEG77399.1 conserved hypothetical protein [Dethiobacter alkaliphilus AHT 1]